MLEDHRKRVCAYLANESYYNGQLRFRVALGTTLPPGSIVRSYRTARTTMMVSGKQRMPESRSYFIRFDAAGSVR